MAGRSVSKDRLESGSDHLERSLEHDTVTVLKASPGIRAGGTFAALKNRNFCLYLLGLVVSLAGTYMQTVAEGWLVYQLTDSPFSLGLVGFVVMVPLGPWALAAGALADRLPRKTLLAIAQVGQIIPPLALAALTWRGSVQVWHVILVNAVMGAMALVDNPTRLALVADVVEPQDLDNALALTASGFNVARVVGPAVSGVLVGSIGPEGAFVLNGLSFMAVLVALIFVRVSTREQPASQASLGANLVEGARYLAGERAILSIIAVMTIVSLFVLPYQTLLPVFARDILQVGAMGLGLLTASAGFGAILGALVVANLSRSRRGMLIMALMLGLSPFTVAFSISRTFWVSCAMLALVSGGIVALKTLGITLIQIQTRDELRGRVTSILLLILGATPRLGGLVAGYLANGLGAPFALGLGALGCLVCGMFALVKFPCIRELP